MILNKGLIIKISSLWFISIKIVVPKQQANEQNNYN